MILIVQNFTESVSIKFQVCLNSKVLKGMWILTSRKLQIIFKELTLHTDSLSETQL